MHINIHISNTLILNFQTEGNLFLQLCASLGYYRDVIEFCCICTLSHTLSVHIFLELVLPIQWICYSFIYSRPSQSALYFIVHRNLRQLITQWKFHVVLCSYLNYIHVLLTYFLNIAFYRPGMVNSKWFISKEFLWNKWKYELNCAL